MTINPDFYSVSGYRIAICFKMGSYSNEHVKKLGRLERPKDKLSGSNMQRAANWAQESSDLIVDRTSQAHVLN